MMTTTEKALQAWDVFAKGVGIFAPSLRTMPVFTELYDAMQDLRVEMVAPDPVTLPEKWKTTLAERERAIKRLRAVIGSVAEHDRVFGAHIAAAMKEFDLRAHAEEETYTTGVWPDYEPTQPPGEDRAEEGSEDA